MTKNELEDVGRTKTCSLNDHLEMLMNEIKRTVEVRDQLPATDPSRKDMKIKIELYQEQLKFIIESETSRLKNENETMLLIINNPLSNIKSGVNEQMNNLTKPNTNKLISKINETKQMMVRHTEDKKAFQKRVLDELNVLNKKIMGEEHYVTLIRRVSEDARMKIKTIPNISLKEYNKVVQNALKEAIGITKLATISYLFSEICFDNPPLPMAGKCIKYHHRFKPMLRRTIENLDNLVDQMMVALDILKTIPMTEQAFTQRFKLRDRVIKLFFKILSISKDWKVPPQLEMMIEEIKLNIMEDIRFHGDVLGEFPARNTNSLATIIMDLYRQLALALRDIYMNEVDIDVLIQNAMHFIMSVDFLDMYNARENNVKLREQLAQVIRESTVAYEKEQRDHLETKFSDVKNKMESLLQRVTIIQNTMSKSIETRSLYREQVAAVYETFKSTLDKLADPEIYDCLAKIIGSLYQQFREQITTEYKELFFKMAYDSVNIATLASLTYLYGNIFLDHPIPSSDVSQTVPAIEDLKEKVCFQMKRVQRESLELSVMVATERRRFLSISNGIIEARNTNQELENKIRVGSPVEGLQKALGNEKKRKDLLLGMVHHKKEEEEPEDDLGILLEWVQARRDLKKLLQENQELEERLSMPDNVEKRDRFQLQFDITALTQLHDNSDRYLVKLQEHVTKMEEGWREYESEVSEQLHDLVNATEQLKTQQVLKLSGFQTFLFKLVAVFEEMDRNDGNMPDHVRTLYTLYKKTIFEGVYCAAHTTLSYVHKRVGGENRPEFSSATIAGIEALEKYLLEQHRHDIEKVDLLRLQLAEITTRSKTLETQMNKLIDHGKQLETIVESRPPTSFPESDNLLMAIEDEKSQINELLDKLQNYQMVLSEIKEKMCKNCSGK
uniref:Uncharacterized protein n=1 Tax=Timema bartmani TaxID=61472 RepID=A0A7R9EW95_9NEOP|nr:unnamed protein product [Timema bartmani]